MKLSLCFNALWRGFDILWIIKREDMFFVVLLICLLLLTNPKCPSLIDFYPRVRRERPSPNPPNRNATSLRNMFSINLPHTHCYPLILLFSFYLSTRFCCCLLLHALSASIGYEPPVHQFTHFLTLSRTNARICFTIVKCIKIQSY